MLQLQKQIIETHAHTFQFNPLSVTCVPSFDRRIASVRDFLPEHTFAILLNAINRQTQHQSVHIPIHKRGAAISYHDLHYRAPEIVAFYHSPELHQWCSFFVGERFVPTPIDDLSSCSVLIYDQAGDRIGWHHDLNFYRGRHFTALLSLVNAGKADGNVSSARLMMRQDKDHTVIPTPANTFVFFEGAFVYHGVTLLREGERRIVLSMTFIQH
ncbi:MAG: hypothetical protein DMG13_04420 [Acidobacteria bacterium]|nr:MAG: hypothetical protein DMG13_04420 [Acidobacteriota bacterium]